MALRHHDIWSQGSHGVDDLSTRPIPPNDCTNNAHNNAFVQASRSLARSIRPCVRRTACDSFERDQSKPCSLAVEVRETCSSDSRCDCRLSFETIEASMEALSATDRVLLEDGETAHTTTMRYAKTRDNKGSFRYPRRLAAVSSIYGISCQRLEVQLYLVLP